MKQALCYRKLLRPFCVIITVASLSLVGYLLTQDNGPLHQVNTPPRVRTPLTLASYHGNVSEYEENGSSSGASSEDFSKLKEATEKYDEKEIVTMATEAGDAENDPSISSMSYQRIFNLTWENLLTSPKPTFLPHYKAPCLEDGNRILCLPYVYLAGMPKSGTTELYDKITRHPDVIRGLKEPHWWTRRRFGQQHTMGQYMRIFQSQARTISRHCYKDGGICYHQQIFMDASASTLWDNYKWMQLPGNEGKTEPVVLNANHIHHLTPDIKILVIFRNPVDRLYSDFLYFNNREKSPENFHKKAVADVGKFQECLAHNSARSCAYNGTLKASLSVRLNIGLYDIYVNDFLNIFSRDQFYFLRLEDYSKNKTTYLKEIFSFLQLSPVNSETFFPKVENLPNKNVRKKRDRMKGDMLRESRKFLRDFYMPFNRQLAETLKDESFTWLL